MNFDRLAPHYDWLEALSGHRLLQQARTAWLGELSDRTNIASIGEGHGRFAEACIVRHPAAALTCVDTSAAMVERAQKRLAHRATGLRCHHGDVLTWRPENRPDALVSCFFLDCFPPEKLAQVVAHLASLAAPDVVWLVTDFALPARGPARWRAQFIHALMYTFFRCTVQLPARRLTPPDVLLDAHGFTLVERREFSWGLIRADVWRRKPEGPAVAADDSGQILK